MNIVINQGTFLSSQLPYNRVKTIITTIKNHEFYSSINDPKLTDIQSFLNKINLTSLTKEQVDYLDMPLTLLELHSASMKIPNNKAPGPDGFPAEFLKMFWRIMAPLFSRMIREVKTNGKIPSHMKKIIIETW